VTLRRLLFAALMALCFDVAVPLEPSVHGGLVWEDDEEEAVRAEPRRDARGATERAPSPRRQAAVIRARVAARRGTPRPVRRLRVAPVLHLAAPPPRPAPTEDH
jgi:hypothetical protein